MESNGQRQEEIQSPIKKIAVADSNEEVEVLIGNIMSGRLGLPDLQRPFVWKDSDVRDLFDSMLHHFPIGYLMLWDCPPDFDKLKSIGSGNARTLQVIIDGQQRLTSLYAVMKKEEVRTKKYKRKLIKISYNPLEDKFEVANPAIKNNPEWIYNISDLYIDPSRRKFEESFINDLKAYREASNKNALTEEEIDLIGDRITELLKLKSVKIPIIEIKANNEEEDVAELFVRVNSKGVALNEHDFILTLYSLHWDEGRKQIEDFCIESMKPSGSSVTAYNQITEVSANDLIRVIMAYGFKRGSLKYGYKLLRGADFTKRIAVDETIRQEQFTILEEKQKDALDRHTWREFIKAIINAGYRSNNMISSKNALFYSYAMYLIAKHDLRIDDITNERITALWFFYVSLLSIYSSSPESTMEGHLSEIKKCKTVQDYKNFILSRVKASMTDDYFTTTLVGPDGLAVSNTKNVWNTYNAALNILNAKVLFSREKILARMFDPDMNTNRNALEIHHLFPKQYLKEQKGKNKTEINQIANCAFIGWTENSKIKDIAPNIYYPDICKGMEEEDILAMEEENALPHNWENMEYEEFLKVRRELMAAKIKEAYEKLRKNVETGA